MAVHKPVEGSGIYFITFTCFKWLRLFELTNSYDEVYKFFDVLNKAGHQVLGYTIMPNHVHLLLYFNKKQQPLNTVIGNGKRFIGYEIVKRLQHQKQEAILSLLKEGVPAVEKQRGKLHQVWQGSFDVKECRTEKFILQKLNYMHANPCTERWKLCEHWHDYGQSSAAYYELGKRDNKWLRDYRDFLSVILEMEERERQI
jgi:REP element-mobilizing transposase RayT